MEKYGISSDTAVVFYASNPKECMQRLATAKDMYPDGVAMTSSRMLHVLGFDQAPKFLAGLRFLPRQTLENEIHIIPEDGAAGVVIYCPNCVRANTD